MDTTISFTKMSGTGNDFIIIDHRKPLLSKEQLAPFARAVCRRKFSVGADGIILIEPSSRADFSWTFMNADGSLAEMCGNGARCAARFAFEKGIAPRSMKFETMAGIIEAEVVDHSVKLRMTDPVGLNLDQLLEITGTELTIHSLNTGVPHAVIYVDDIQTPPVEIWGRTIRYHQHFQPAGTNVNFVHVASGSKIYVRTYERGVEGETLACGTGAVASAILCAIHGKVIPPVSVITTGGEELRIHFTLRQAENAATLAAISDVYLEGPAQTIYEGQLHADALIDSKTTTL